MTEERKKIDKIYKQIDALAKSGKDQVFEYYIFIDDLINKSQYGYFEQCLYIYYKIEIINLNINDVKKKTWPEILFQTNSTFQTKLKKMYDKKSVYQHGYNIYSATNSVIGQVKELDQYSPEIKYLIENIAFAKAMGKKVTYLDVTKYGPTSSYMIGSNVSNIETIQYTGPTSSIATIGPVLSTSEEQNLLNRYSAAIDILLS